MLDPSSFVFLSLVTCDLRTFDAVAGRLVSAYDLLRCTALHLSIRDQNLKSRIRFREGGKEGSSATFVVYESRSLLVIKWRWLASFVSCCFKQFTSCVQCRRNDIVPSKCTVLFENFAFELSYI